MILKALVLRTLTGGFVAFSSWRMLDGTISTTKIKQTDYDNFALVGKGIGDPPGRPDPNAVFLMAAGGIPAINTPSGWPAIGDCWETVDSDTGVKSLQIAIGPDVEFGHSFYSADEPINGQSNIIGVITRVSNQITFLKIYSLAEITGSTVQKTALQLGTYVPLNTISPSVVGGVLAVPDTWSKIETNVIIGTIPNHKSVSFDAASNGDTGSGGTATSLTVAHTVTNTQSNLYIAGFTATRTGQTISSVVWNGVGLTQRLNQTSSSTARANLWDLVNPATGTHNNVFTFSAATSAVCGSVSAYGVDQTTPRSNTNSAGSVGTSTTPALTITSAVGELVITGLCWEVTDPSTNTTDTIDASFTTDWNDNNTFSAGGNMRAGSAAHKTGAASVTRTDTLSIAREWAIVGASLKASGGVKTLAALGVG